MTERTRPSPTLSINSLKGSPYSARWGSSDISIDGTFPNQVIQCLAGQLNDITKPAESVVPQIRSPSVVLDVGNRVSRVN